MPPAWRQASFQNRDRLGRIGTVGWLPGLGVPQLPGRPVHDRLGKQRRNVEIVPMGAIHLAHGGGVVVVPDRRDRCRCRRTG